MLLFFWVIPTIYYSNILQVTKNTTNILLINRSIFKANQLESVKYSSINNITSKTDEQINNIRNFFYHF